MAVTQYIGARYVPLFVGEWDSSVEYEPLSIVSYQGASYTSRQAVPIGIDINNEEFWALTGNYNAQVEAYRREVLEFDGRIETLETDSDDFQTRISTLETSTEDTEERLSILEAAPHDIVFGQNPFYNVASNMGDDETGAPVYALDDDSTPFKTLQAAIDNASKKGNYIYAKIIEAGTYNLDFNSIIGSVVHIYSPTSETVNIRLTNSQNSDEMFLYDTHINFYGNPQNKLRVDVDRSLEIEGSTLVTTNVLLSGSGLNDRGIHLIQGSAIFTNTEIENTWVNAYAAWVKVSNVQITHSLPVPALQIVQGGLRMENEGLQIGDNPNGGNTQAVRVLGGVANITDRFTSTNGQRTSWGSLFEARQCQVYCLTLVWNGLAEYAQGAPIITSIAERIGSLSREQQYGTATVDAPANSYTDIPITFGAPFQRTPIVFTSIVSGSTSPEIGNITASPISTTTNGFTLRVFNNGNAQRSPVVNWIAFS